MKYLEELNIGDTFYYQNNMYLLTSDFKANGHRLCYSLNDGSPLWLSNQTIIENLLLYSLDKDNNIFPLKPLDKPNVLDKI